jgi:hypothetical protein
MSGCVRMRSGSSRRVRAGMPYDSADRAGREAASNGMLGAKWRPKPSESEMSSGPTRIRGPHRASMRTVPINKIIVLPDGTEKEAGHATGFLYRRANTTWLVTCWHVLTGRRPDEPGFLVTKENGQSPSRIKIVRPLKQTGAFSKPEVIDLYKADKPIWLERDRDRGVDLAAIPIELPKYLSDICVQDAVAADSEDGAVEIGMDVVITGYPLGFGAHSPFPFGKRL